MDSGAGATVARDITLQIGSVTETIQVRAGGMGGGMNSIGGRPEGERFRRPFLGTRVG